VSRALALLLWAAPALAASAPAPKQGAAPGSGAAAKPARKVPELSGEAVEFQTRDGWTLSGKYSPAKGDELTFVLLHDQKGRHQDWRRLTAALARQGIGYLAFDLRGHGLSQKAPEGQPSDWRQFKADKTQNDWDNMREDAAAAAEFLKGKGVADNLIAFGGSDIGGSIALKYAAVHPEVPMVFLLSPGMTYRNVTTVNAMRAYKDRPILLVSGDADKYSAEAKILAVFAKNSVGAENLTVLTAPRGHGVQLLYQKGVVDKILDWIDNPVQSPDLGASEGGQPPAGSPSDGTSPPPPAVGADGLPSEQQMDRKLGDPDAVNP
jgi:dienelactone hydrolase